MKLSSLISCCLLFAGMTATASHAQSPQKKKAPAVVAVEKEGVTFRFVEEMPRFPGDSVTGYIRHHLVYPKAAREKGIEGRVIVQFIVRKDGRVTDPEILRGL